MRHNERGLSLIEVVIASIIMAVLAAMVFMMLATAADRTETDQAALTVEERARQILDDISKDIRMANGGSIVVSGAFTGLPSTPTPHPATGFGNQIQFNMMTNSTGTDEFQYGVAGGGPQFNNLCIYRTQLEVDPTPNPSGLTETLGDYLDNDQDKLIDESTVIREYREGLAGTLKPSRIGSGVRMLAFRASGGSPNVINIYIEMQWLDKKGNLLTRPGSTSVAVRN